MRKAITALLLLALLAPGVMTSAGHTEAETAPGGVIDVTVTPDTPEPGEQITASFSAPEGALNATLQVCIGDKCFIPAEMERQGDMFRHTFYINETGEAHLNVTVEFPNGTETWENASTFQVKKAGGGSMMPGFTAGAVMAAATAIAVLRRRTKS